MRTGTAAVLNLIAAERERQISEEGYTRQHDAEHNNAQLAAAAGCYALFTDAYPNAGQPPPHWPWESGAWKPKDYKRDLVRAAALLVAELERLEWLPPNGTGEPK